MKRFFYLMMLIMVPLFAFSKEEITKTITIRLSDQSHLTGMLVMETNNILVIKTSRGITNISYDDIQIVERLLVTTNYLTNQLQNDNSQESVEVKAVRQHFIAILVDPISALNCMISLNEGITLNLEMVSGIGYYHLYANFSKMICDFTYRFNIYTHNNIGPLDGFYIGSGLGLLNESSGMSSLYIFGLVESGYQFLFGNMLIDAGLKLQFYLFGEPKSSSKLSPNYNLAVGLTF